MIGNFKKWYIRDFTDIHDGYGEIIAGIARHRSIRTHIAVQTRDTSAHWGQTRVLFEDTNRRSWGYLLINWGEGSGRDALKSCWNLGDEYPVVQLAERIEQSVVWLWDEPMLAYLKQLEATEKASYSSTQNLFVRVASAYIYAQIEEN